MTTRGSPDDSRPRHPVVPEGEQTWMDQENSACHFRDERLKKRFRLLHEQFWKNMGQSIPFTCQDWASTKAAYRFFPTTTSASRTYWEAIFRRQASASPMRKARYLFFNV